MLNGIDPIIIFQFSKNVFAPGNSKVPITNSVLSKLPLPAIPIYLSESITGVYIDTEDKSIDIATDTESLLLSPDPIINQRCINNVVKVTMLASVDSIGLTLFSALTDVVFPLVTSREYSITYMHGAIVVLQGLLHSFNITQESNSTLYHITMELIKPGVPQNSKSVMVSANPGVALEAGRVP